MPEEGAEGCASETPGVLPPSLRRLGQTGALGDMLCPARGLAVEPAGQPVCQEVDEGRFMIRSEALVSLGERGSHSQASLQALYRASQLSPARGRPLVPREQRAFSQSPSSETSEGTRCPSSAPRAQVFSQLRWPERCWRLAWRSAASSS